MTRDLPPLLRNVMRYKIMDHLTLRMHDFGRLSRLFVIVFLATLPLDPDVTHDPPATADAVSSKEAAPAASHEASLNHPSAPAKPSTTHRVSSVLVLLVRSEFQNRLIRFQQGVARNPRLFLKCFPSKRHPHAAIKKRLKREKAIYKRERARHKRERARHKRERAPLHAHSEMRSYVIVHHVCTPEEGSRGVSMSEKRA